MWSTCDVTLVNLVLTKREWRVLGDGGLRQNKYGAFSWALIGDSEYEYDLMIFDGGRERERETERAI